MSRVLPASLWGGAVNGMRYDTHLRMTLTRGAKASSSMNPHFNVFGCSLLIVPEWKPVRAQLPAVHWSDQMCPCKSLVHCQFSYMLLPYLLVRIVQVGNAATYNNDTGIALVTSAGRRNGPSCVDSKIHHCNLINNSKIRQSADKLSI